MFYNNSVKSYGLKSSLTWAVNFISSSLDKTHFFHSVFGCAFRIPSEAKTSLPKFKGNPFDPWIVEYKTTPFGNSTTK